MSADTAAQSRTLYAQLLALPAPLYPAAGRFPADGLDAALQAQTAALLAHPALECAYHLLNHALYPAHFLVRHMQNARAGQHLHGILHRIEGDYANARVWYREASGLGERANEATVREGEEEFVRFWSGVAGVGAGDDERRRKEKALDAAMAYLDRVEKLKNASKGQVQDAGRGTEERKDLEKLSRAELVSVVEWIAAKYGWGRWNGGDASRAYTESTDEQKREMVDQQSGGEGFRKF
ncbi:hypothetical protein PHLGIDRAFT_408501 [Phlebiopsis gigantea 11061_1 CR5-6]|uniref:Uncharacterized protein n=1 Tax=Phlebiopsis gigantea (strain 11061_1 CR5-6) TaxID=745531 RepID=A0A0C3RZG6_PHLG1|nr:hypothetical protein PHLGIDRAFT_408501 [Phlebiopsis gigantea 11061_1 CR5-6]